MVTQTLISGIMTVMIGAVLLIVGSTVISAIGDSVFNAMPTLNVTDIQINTTTSNISAAFSIAGVGLVVMGVSAVIYMLINFNSIITEPSIYSPSRETQELISHMEQTIPTEQPHIAAVVPEVIAHRQIPDGVERTRWNDLEIVSVAEAKE